MKSVSIALYSLVSTSLLLAHTVAADEACHRFYSHHPIEIHVEAPIETVDEQPIPDYKTLDSETRLKEMNDYSLQLLRSMSTAEILPSDFFYAAVAQVRARNGINFDSGRVRKNVDLISGASPQNEQVNRALQTFQNRVEQLLSKIEELGKEKTRKTGLFSTKADNSKAEYDLMLEISDLFGGLEKDLEYLSSHKLFLTSSQDEIRKQFRSASLFERQAIGYLEEISYLDSSILVNQAQFPWAGQKVAVISGLFKAERQDADGILQQARAMKDALEIRAGTNALAVQYIDHQKDYTLASLFIQSGITPQIATQIIDNFQKHFEANKTELELRTAKIAKSAAIRANVRRMAIVPAVVLSLAGGGYGVREAMKEKPIPPPVPPPTQQALYDQAYSKITSLSQAQQNLMAKYRQKVPVMLLNYIEIAKSPKMAADYLSKMDTNTPLDPEFVIYMTNYAPRFLGSDYSNITTPFAAVIDTFLVRKLTRDYTAEEKIEIVSSINSIRERWNEFYKIDRTAKLEESDIAKYKSGMDVYFDNRISFQLSTFEITKKTQADAQIAKEALDAKTKKDAAELEEKKRIQKDVEKAELAGQAAAVKRLGQTPRLKITSETDLVAMAQNHVNPSVVAIFKSETNQVTLSKLMDYSKLGKISNYDLIYILKKIEKIGFITEKNTDRTVAFYGRLNAFGNTGYRETADLRHVALETILLNIKLETMNVHELNLLKESLSGFNIQNKEWSEYTPYGVKYLLSLLDPKVKIGD